MTIEQDVTYPMESSRQGFVFGALLVGYGAFRITTALPDPDLCVGIETSLMLWIQTGVGLVGLMAGSWLLYFHRSQRRAAARTLEASRRMLQGIHSLTEALQGLGRALVDVGPGLACDIEEVQRDHLTELVADAGWMAEARVRNGRFVAEAMDRVGGLLNAARSAAIDHRGEDMITLTVACEKHLKKAAEALER